MFKRNNHYTIMAKVTLEEGDVFKRSSEYGMAYNGNFSLVMRRVRKGNATTWEPEIQKSPTSDFVWIKREEEDEHLRSFPELLLVFTAVRTILKRQ